MDAVTSRGRHYHTIQLYDNSRAILGDNTTHPTEVSSASERNIATCQKFVFPLAIEALNLWHTAITAISKFRDINKSIKACAQSLKSSREIYHHALRSILNFYESSEIVDEMLLDSEHFNWTSTDLNRHVQRLCAKQTPALKESFNDIATSLRSVSNFVTALKTEYKLIREHSHSLPTSHVRVMFTSAISRFVEEHRVLDILDTLSDDVADLETLINDMLFQYRRPRLAVINKRARNELTKFQFIRSAANDLFAAVNTACTRHSTHESHLRLAVDHLEQRCQFRLFLTPIRASESLTKPSDNACVYLTIEASTVTTELESTTILGNAPPGTRVGKRKMDDDGRCSEIPATKAHVHLHDETSQSKISTTARSVLSEQSSAITRVQHICEQVRAILRKGSLIYISRQIVPDMPQELVRTSRNLLSFRDACKGLSGSKRLSKHERAILAKQFALAVLQYHATPWLETSWSTDHISIELCNSDPGARGANLHSYISVPGSLCSSAPSSAPHGGLVHNKILFGLAVMLLELAYKKPISLLQKNRDVDPQNPQDTMYHTAKRLQGRVSSRMGKSYSDVVSRCLYCDFGKGRDLSEMPLQEAFYENAFLQLEDLERKLADIKL